MSNKILDEIKSLESDTTEVKKGRGRPQGSTAGASKEPATNAMDIAEKIHLIFSLPFLITRKENPYKPIHFKNEAEAVKRLMNKYDILKKVFNLFDPIIIIMGIIDKAVNASRTAKGESPTNENNDS